MKEIIIKILNSYKENVSLSEGHNDYLIWGDIENIEQIAQEIEKELKINLVE
jgi:hypothetical protein